MAGKKKENNTSEENKNQKKESIFFKIKDSKLKNYKGDIFFGKKKEIDIGKSSFDSLVEEDISQTKEAKSLGKVLLDLESINKQIINDFYFIRGNVRSFHNIFLENNGELLTFKNFFEMDSETTSEGQEISEKDYWRGIHISYKKLYEIIIALQTSNFLIFSGPSGVGKTILVENLATSFGGRFEKLAIKSDFVDETSIFGYWNGLLSKYEKENNILEFIYQAINNPDIPYFLLLDEMNLSRIENYFSSFLSAGEKEDTITILNDVFIKTYSQYENIKMFFENLPNFSKDDYLLEIDNESKNFPNYDEDSFKKFTLSLKIKFPSNLKIIGTINEDETTYSLSSKVLDRAFLIMFDEAKIENQEDDFLEKLDLEKNIEDIVNLSKESFKNLDFSDDLKDFFQKLNENLKELNIFYTIGYRSLELIGSYMKKYLSNLNYNIDLKTASLNNEEIKNLLDIVLMQKVVPKINSYLLMGKQEGNYNKFINFLKENLGEYAHSVKLLKNNEIF